VCTLSGEAVCSVASRGNAQRCAASAPWRKKQSTCSSQSSGAPLIPNPHPPDLTVSHPLCRAECANLGLKALARGGVYIAGGIPGKLLPAITSGGGHLQSAFLKPHCRFAKVRATLPLHLVRHPDPGLRGALAVALRECGGRK